MQKIFSKKDQNVKFISSFPPNFSQKKVHFWLKNLKKDQIQQL
jgi:hypothetical protein